jgi:uncharacterized protein (TIGR00730 family)
MTMPVPTRAPRTVCVFCGAKSGNHTDYIDIAAELGVGLAKHGIRLVYGGSGLGVMAAIANAVIDAGGEVVGVIPHHLVEMEQVTSKVTHTYVVKSMHARKSLMYKLSDAFVALPGGMGTLDELFEVLTWTKLGLHSKPVTLLNTKGYFDHLLRWLDHARDTGFVGGGDHGILRISETVDDVLADLGVVPRLPDPASALA